ncbi:MAG: hypothetical protein H6605_09840 [Flavobacteriales bacterium]|nr:hypothetical protein [Flavobacteriales bacterium]
MRRIISLIPAFVLLFATFNAMAQKFTILNDNGKYFFKDEFNPVEVSIEGTDPSKVLLSISGRGILKGKYGVYQVFASNCESGDAIALEVLLKSEQGNISLGSDTFYVAVKNKFETHLGEFHSGDQISVEQFLGFAKPDVSPTKIKPLIISDPTELISFEFDIVSDYLEKKSETIRSDKITEEIKNKVRQLKSGDQIVFHHVLVKSKEGTSVSSGMLLLTIANSGKPELKEFKHEASYTVEYILNTNSISLEDEQKAGKILSYEIALVPRRGHASFLRVNGNLFSEQIREHFKTILLPGDKIIFDNIRYLMPDGNSGKCNPVVIKLSE